MVSFIISYTFGRVRKVSHFSRSPPLLLLLLPLSNGWWTVVFRCAPRRMNFKSCSLDRKKIFQGWILAGRFRYERIKFIINFHQVWSKVLKITKNSRCWNSREFRFQNSRKVYHIECDIQGGISGKRVCPKRDRRIFRLVDLSSRGGRRSSRS